MGMRERLSSLVLHAPDDARAICFMDEWWDWARVRRLSAQVGELLDAANLGPGARVGIALQNRPACLVIVLAVLASGRCVTTLNSLQPQDRFISDVERSELPVVFGSTAQIGANQVLEAIRNTGGEIIIEDDGSLNGSLAPQDWSDSAYSHGSAVEIFTSGTTGPPKRVKLADRQFDSSFGSFSTSADHGFTNPRLSSGLTVVNAPLAHIGGLWNALSAIYAGRRVVLMDRFRVEDWVEAIETHRPRLASVVPAALQALLEARIDPQRLSSLEAISSGTAPCPPDLVDAFRTIYGIPVLTTYGATEFAGAVAAWTLEDYRVWGERKRGSVGRAFRGIVIRATDPETGEVLPAGEVGTLEVKAGQLVGDGWTRTSDLGKVDKDGFVYLTGRSDDAIIRGGFKVHRGSIQKAIERHPDVRAAAVAAKPHRRLGAVPVAAVELIPGRTLDVADLGEFCRRELIPYEVPAELKIVDALPRTQAMKVSLVDVLDLFPEEAV